MSVVYYGFFIPPTKHGKFGDGGSYCFPHVLKPSMLILGLRFLTSARLSLKSPRIRLCEDPKRHLQGQSLWQSCLRPVPPASK